MLVEQELDAIRLHALLWKKLGNAGTPPRVWDVGGNTGQTARAYLDEISGAQLTVFEANPHLIDSCKLALADSKTFVTLKNLALQGNPNLLYIDFYINQDDGTSSILTPEDDLIAISSAYQAKEICRIESSTIDREVDAGMHFPDILKTDVQGSDLEVLKGGLELLKTQKVSIVSSEVYFSRAYKNQCYFHDVAYFMDSVGYKFYNFSRLVNAKNGNLYFGDATFVSNNAWKKISNI